MIGTIGEIKKQIRDEQNRAIQTWNFVYENEPIVRKNPVRVGFNLNLKFSAACRVFDNKDIKKYLVGGVDINYVGLDDLTTLYNVIIDKYCDVVRLLVESDVDVNTQDTIHWIPLHSAIKTGDLEIIKIILDNGADPSLVNSDEKLPIDLARNLQTSNLIQKKMDEFRLNIVSLRKREHLLTKRDIERWRGKKNWDGKCRFLSGCYEVHVCATKDYLPKFYELLIYIGCDRNLKDDDRWTPLHGAVYWNNSDAAILLAKNELKKIEDSVKLFNAINTNNSIVIAPNQMVTHYESECERKIISRQRRSARTSTCGIIKDELWRLKIENSALVRVLG